MKKYPQRFERIATVLFSLANCRKSGNAQWESIWEARLADLLEAAPSGSGFDNGTTLAESESSADKLVFYTAFHHMDSNGFYDGWTEHKVTVRPSFVFGFTLTISGRDRNQIKDYIAEIFHEWLGQFVADESATATERSPENA